MKRKRGKKQVKGEISLDTWSQLRRLVEAGRIKNILDGVSRAVEEFVTRKTTKGD